jgi:hypothetical protein
MLLRNILKYTKAIDILKSFRCQVSGVRCQHTYCGLWHEKALSIIDFVSRKADSETQILTPDTRNLKPKRAPETYPAL